MESEVSHDQEVHVRYSSSNSSVITDSIIENKAQTKRYWERRMSAESQDIVKSSVTPMDSRESLIEREIRVQREREQALEQERQAAIKLAKVMLPDTYYQPCEKPKRTDRYQKQTSYNGMSNAPIPAARKNFSQTSLIGNSSSKVRPLNKRFSSMSNLHLNNGDVTNGYLTMVSPTSPSASSKQSYGFKTQKGLMQKFLENHSKKNNGPTTTQPAQTAPVAQVHRRPRIDFSDIEPNQSQNHPNWTKRPGYVSTEDKIQKELEEMRLRENELKSERAKMFGWSQPNLVTVGLDKESDTDSGNESMGQLRSVLSNPNLLDEKDCDDDCVEFKPVVKKKSALFEAWERRVREHD